MAKGPVNLAASVKDRLLNLARREGRDFGVVLVRYALERLLYRLSLSKHRDRFVLKGGMLVTIWLHDDNRETRDADFLGHGDTSEESLRATFAEIMSMPADDGLEFDVAGLSATTIREEMEYGGIRLRTIAYLERTRINVTIDIGFGDALADAPHQLAYPSLLGMESPEIRSYPPAAVVAEKFQAMVALGVANGRMKDYYDLWAIPKTVTISNAELEGAIRATFDRRGPRSHRAGRLAFPMNSTATTPSSVSGALTPLRSILKGSLSRQSLTRSGRWSDRAARDQQSKQARHRTQAWLKSGNWTIMTSCCGRSSSRHSKRAMTRISIPKNSSRRSIRG